MKSHSDKNETMDGVISCVQMDTVRGSSQNQSKDTHIANDATLMRISCHPQKQKLTFVKKESLLIPEGMTIDMICKKELSVQHESVSNMSTAEDISLPQFSPM